MIVVSDLSVSLERHAVLPDAQRELHRGQCTVWLGKCRPSCTICRLLDAA
jgi:hypothetical protein